MIRTIIHIDEEKCSGCGICATACHEGAIQMVNGKARLVRENFCDGLGDCLPACPTGAISFEEREAPAYDAEAVKRNKMIEEAMARAHAGMPGGSCPGSAAMQFDRSEAAAPAAQAAGEGQTAPSAAGQTSAGPASGLAQWPCQIKLLPVKAPFFDGARLLIAADCTAFAYAGIHADFMRGRVTVIGCPKLDDIDYAEKLTAIIAENDIREVTILRMEVPCCGGLQMAAQKALQASGKFIPWQVVTISRDGRILDGAEKQTTA